MLKKFLDEIKKTIRVLPKDLKLSATLLSLVQEDIDNLVTNFDGPDGFVDFYSPKAEQQINDKQKLFEKYREHLTTLLAVVICYHQNEDKKGIAPISDVSDLNLVLEREDVQEVIKNIAQIEKDRTNLQNIELQLKKDDELEEEDEKMNFRKRSDLENKKKKLMEKVQEFDNKLKNIPGTKEIKIDLNSCKRESNRISGIKEQLPKGMLDIKRALSLLDGIMTVKSQLRHQKAKLRKTDLESTEKINTEQKIEKLELELKQKEASVKFSLSDEDDRKIKEMLHDLRSLMTMSIKDYQKLAVSGGPINAYLHKTTGFYWENLLLYREILSEINEYLKSNKNLSEEGKLVAECISNAFEQMPKIKTINSALQKVKKIDGKLQEQEKEYDTKVDDTSIRFYKKPPVKFVERLLNSGADQKSFYIPYNPYNYVLDHPARSDFADTCGNCYGETQMFLKQINGTSPSINNICPERILINYQLDQTRTIAKGKEEIGTYQATGEGEKVTWSGIKNILTSEVKSGELGDVCMITLSGAKIPGREKLVGHGIGLIKMKNPDPYKYVVYDYAFGGAMGFSSDDQLELFFKKIFEEAGAYYPFKKCVVEKVGEVSKQCEQFIQNIGSLEKNSLDKTCERSFWDKSRVNFLIKYQPTKINKILEAIDKLPLLEERVELSKQLAINPKVSIYELVQCILNTNRIDLLAIVLTSEATFTNKTKLSIKNDEVRNKIVNLINDDKIDPIIASKVFANQQAIILAAYKKNPDSLAHADIDQVLALLKKPLTLSPLDVCKAFPGVEQVVLAASISDPSSLQFAKLSVVQSLLRKGSITPEQAYNAFSDNAEFKSAHEAYTQFKSLMPLTGKANESDKEERINLLKLMDQNLVNTNLRKELSPLIKNICVLLLNDIKTLSPHDEMSKNRRLSRLVNSGNVDMELLIRLENKKMELNKTDYQSKLSYTFFDTKTVSPKTTTPPGDSHVVRGKSNHK